MNRSDKISLDSSFGYLLRRMHVKADRVARKMLEPFDITPARVTALIVVANNPGCTQSALGDALSINRASTMKLVNFLERRGLIHRDKTLDSRANALFVSDEGEVQLIKMVAALKEADIMTLESLSEGERNALYEFLESMRQGPTGS